MDNNSLTMKKEVIQTINSYLEDNRTFKVKKIIPYIKTKLSKKGINLNQNGIKKILSILLNRRIIVEGSKLTKNEILKNSKRKAIYEFIKKHPGSIPNKIMSELKISNYEIFWHLKMLKKFDFISKEKIQGHDAFFASETIPKEMEKQFIINKPKSKQIIHYLKRNNIGVTKTRIADDLSMHFNTVAKYLKLLQNIDIVIKDKRSDKTLYFLKN